MVSQLKLHRENPLPRQLMSLQEHILTQLGQLSWNRRCAVDTGAVSPENPAPRESCRKTEGCFGMVSKTLLR